MALFEAQWLLRIARRARSSRRSSCAAIRANFVDHERKPTQVSFGLRIYPGVMQFQLIFRSAHGDRFELRDVGHAEPTVEGQVIADGEIIAIHGSLWKATRLDSHGVTGFVVTPADTAPEPA
jgi:hypothetical protein